MKQLSGHPRAMTTTQRIALALILQLGFFCLPNAQAQIWSNEIHYQNAGIDEGERIELAGLAGTSLAGWSVVLYDGSTGATYGNTVTLTGALPAANCTVNGQGIGFYVIDVPTATGQSFQGGAAFVDGWALVNGSTVVEFFSYGGTMTATNGPANGMTSINIGITEPSTALVGSSLQRTGTLSWVFGDGTNTFGACNTTQYNPNAPQPPSGNAGPDQEISVVQTATLSALAVNGTGAWSVFSGPSTASSQFNNTASANAVFTPAGGPGTYVLRWTVTNGSGSVSDDVNIIVYPLPPAASLRLFSNEIHYQNTGQDLNERIEIAGPAGTSLTNWRIQFYDGSNGQVYATANLSGTLPNSCTVNDDNIGVVVVDVMAATGSGIQGGPDGWALVFGATPVEFLSYGGTFTATNGFANGMTSLDIGAAEPSNTAATSSIQRTTTTMWVFGEGTNTFGACNSTQYNPNGPLPPAANAGPDREISLTGVAQLAAIATNGTGAWSVVSGPSTLASQFSSATAANATFTPAGGVGTYTLRWTVSAMGFPDATDDMTVTVYPLPPSQCDRIFSNEIHYQNDGADINEKIEFAGKAGTSLTNWKVQLYEGSNGNVITTINLSGTLPNTCTVSGINMGVHVLDVFAVSGFALGSGPDGWALVFGATPVEFWSYGGTFTANNGFAAGMTSTNIGATEPTNTSANSSIQRNGLSTWVFAEGSNTFGACNTTQYFCPEPVANAGANQLRCSLTPATLAAEAFNGTGAWSVVSGPSTLATQFSSTTAANATFTPAGGLGTYTLRWTVTGSNGTATDDVQITYSTPPTANITGELVICPSGSRVLTATGGTAYQWSTGSTTATTTVTAAATYTVTVANAAGCSTTRTATTSILTAGSISANPNNTAGLSRFWTCFGSTITLSSNGTPGGTWVAYEKFPAPNVVSVNQMGVVTPLFASISVDTHSVAYIVSAPGCSLSTGTTVEVRGLNPGTISGNTNLCTGNVGNTSTLTTNGATGGTWSSSNPGIATVNSSGLVTSVAPGMTTISYTVTGQGCTNAATTVVNVTVCCAAPVAICQPATVILAGNSATLSAAAVNNNSTAACGLQSTAVSPSTFNCSQISTPQTVTLTVTDINGTTSTCQTTVTVRDNTPPTITCPDNTTVNANASCQGTVGARMPTFRNDNCNPSPSVAQSPAASTILSGHNSAQIITLTANDGNGNTATCQLTVTLRDVTPPSITCKPTTVSLFAGGSASITPADVFQGGSDNCGMPNPISVSPNAFICSNLGANTVTLTANDGNGNTATCTATVTVNVLTTFYQDADGDGFGNPAAPQQACAAPNGYVSNNTDCNDNNPAVSPAATEACNGVDDDCDGSVDEGVLITYYQDADGDGFGNPAAAQQACSQPQGFVTNNQDCDDNNPAVYPGAKEQCNGLDDDCDGNADEGQTSTYYQDSDGDGFGDGSTSVQLCGPSQGYAELAGDCDDGDPDIYPGAPELCDGVDSNCDTKVDTEFGDSDGDQWPDCLDNCPSVFNPDQTDLNENGVGDPCEGLNVCSLLKQLAEPVASEVPSAALKSNLLGLIVQALNQMSAGNGSGALATLNAFVAEVNAQSGVGMTSALATALLQQAGAIIAAIQNGADCGTPTGLGGNLRLGGGQVVVQDFDLYPNPTTGRSVTLRWRGPAPGAGSGLMLLDGLGRPVAELPALTGQPEQQLELGGIPGGVYRLRATLGDRVLLRTLVLIGD
jgi:hypothetical protein